MRIVVLGGEGMLGHKMFQVLRVRYRDTHCTLYRALSDPLCQPIELFQQGNVVDQLDVMDWPTAAGRLRELRPDFLVNCVGIIKQRPAARDAIASITLNALLPHRLAVLLASWGGRLVHFSTDCVFDGKKGAYLEDSPSDAEDLYGKSKFLGEVTGDNALTLRTSIIGRELAQFKSLLEWFLSNRGGRVRGFRRVIYSGVTTNFMAELVGRIITDHPHLTGLYQVASPPISKYDLLSRLAEAYRMPVEIDPDDEVVSDRSMIGDRFLAATGYQQPTWPELVAQLVADTTPYDAWRGGHRG